MSRSTDEQMTLLTAAIDDLYLTMRRARALSSRIGQPPLSVSQLALLAPLHHDESLTVGQLAGAAGIATPTATRMLKQLETIGIIDRRRSAVDERRVVVRLTPNGMLVLTAARNRLRQRQIAGLSQLSSDERASLTALLTRLNTVITDVAGNDLLS